VLPLPANTTDNQMFPESSTVNSIPYLLKSMYEDVSMEGIRNRLEFILGTLDRT
jgi:hypothetical protein